MSRTYFISDTHLGHMNILRYEPCRIDATLDYIKNVLRLDIDIYSKSLGLDHVITKEDVLKDFETAEKTIVRNILMKHDEMLIHNWNSKVKNTDTVWFLGDFALGNKEYVKTCISKLNGIKRMIKGNHDNFPDDFYREAGFVFVSKYPTILKNFFVLSHHPMEWMNPASSPFYFIFGHVHSSPQFTTKTINSRCVCVERHNFTPIEIEEYNNFEATINSTGEEKSQ